MTIRDSMHRCKICKRLWRDEECILEINKEGGSDEGLKCPNKCISVYKQEEYELPTND